MKKPQIRSERLRTASAIAAVLLLALALIAGLIATVVHSEGGPISTAVAAVLAVAFFAFMLRIDVAKAQRTLDAARAGLPVIAFAIVFMLMGNTPGTTKFDEIGAQVIVVLLLALAVDARFFRLEVERDRWDTIAIVFTMIVLAAGEYYALRGLLTEDPTHAEMAGGAIAAGFVAVAISALAGPQNDPHREDQDDG